MERRESLSLKRYGYGERSANKYFSNYIMFSFTGGFLEEDIKGYGYKKCFTISCVCAMYNHISEFEILCENLLCISYLNMTFTKSYAVHT